ncbi:kinase-like protein [Aspergillus heteromorphus CBS 117.55]|uniref:non-specific serine/threonine protein kinase n=1 Tax=Aspergillus heteromorphus CBS 117.55 TaxID=1448321 RepID=A0A317VXL9_9EURO|nr:kinase-like protein [Aspergillus heteromorphus CBS 117.55]PWY78379.1 kinase-like protein [Aspergillus heteromorphus CBS 117.55]
MNLAELLQLMPGGGRTMTLDAMKPVIRKLLHTLDFLHSEAGIVHTDIQPKNLLLPAPSADALSAFEQRELSSPAPRKVARGRTIYTTSRFPAGDGLPQLIGLGQARSMRRDYDEPIAMPDHYRAPEVLLNSEWGMKLDIWSVAMTAWDMVSPQPLIQAPTKDGISNNVAHIAELIALLGPPPPTLLKWKASREFWDENGRWRNLAPIPARIMEELAAGIQGERDDVEGFLRWLRSALRWIPQDRPTAQGLLNDPWLLKGGRGYWARGCLTTVRLERERRKDA